MLPFPPVSQKKKIAIIPGDGIGREVIPEAVKAITASGADVEMSQFDWSADRYLADGVTVPPDGFAMLGRASIMAPVNESRRHPMAVTFSPSG